jgi:hypothetical protein
MPGEEFHPDKVNQEHGGPDIDKLRAAATEAGFGPEGSQPHAEVPAHPDGTFAESAPPEGEKAHAQHEEEQNEKGGNAEAVGGVAVSGSDPEILNGEAGNDDPATQQWREENWEHDDKKTEAVARSSEKERGEQYEDEAAIKAAKEFLQAPRWEKGVSGSGFYDYDDKTRALIEQGLDTEYIGDVFGEGPKASEAHERAMRRLNSLQKETQRLEEESRRLEDWAAILHDRPVSQEYLEANPDLDLEPASLVEMEEYAEDDLDLAERLELAAKTINGLEVFEGAEVGFHSREDFGLNRLLRSHEDIERWKELRNNGSTTLDQVAEFYREMLNARKITPLRNRANAQKAILEDVRSGRAADYKGGESSSAEQVHTDSES